MAIAEDEERSILVGLPMDAVGKNLLEWTLNKAARHGDRVVAVHVYQKSELSKMKNTLSLIRELDDFLAQYETLCRTKRVSLVGRVTPGSSIQSTLVKEAESCSAAAVVVGANKNFSLGGPACLAKYCAKKLPARTAVTAVDDGKIIFHRDSPRLPPPAREKPPPPTNLGSLLHPSVSMDARAGLPSTRRTARSMDFDAEARRITACRRESRRSPSCIADASFSSAPEEKLGWPLLRRVPSNIDVPKADDDLRKLSVVQWAMNLPRRSLSSYEPQAELIRDLKRIVGEHGCSGVRWFRYDELYSASNHFSSENLIGKGGSSKVYKGCLPGGTPAAIKLSKFNAEAGKDFLREVDIVTKLQHRRIVPLLGICVEGNNLISAYNYIPRGSLEDSIHGKRSKPALPWDKRYRVATAMADVVAYLHAGNPRPVIHRDIKSSNILLTGDLEPQLSDFGLAMWAPKAAAFVKDEDVVGTFGYLAPEYLMFGKVSCKIDVYAFGVVLLELLTGKRPISSDPVPKGQESLVMWATPLLKRGDIGELVDPNLDGKYDDLQLRRMSHAAALCITRSARLRPQMSQIKRLLEGDDECVPSLFLSCQRLTSMNGLEQEEEEDGEASPAASVRPQLDQLVLIDADDDTSVSSTEHSNVTSSEDCISDRWSRSSSFD